MKIYCDACCGRGFKVDKHGWDNICQACEGKGYTRIGLLSDEDIYQTIVELGFSERYITDYELSIARAIESKLRGEK